ncbi:MAG: multicopper oxidase family protein [Betaproteobacteria bacterium]|nr:multicopper oxidase family protein [Betaproteobacteria bacterium]
MKMIDFNRRKFLITGAAVLGAAGVVAGVGWWYRARRAPHAGMETGAAAFPNALRLPGTSGVLGVMDVAAPFTMLAKPVQHAILEGKPAPVLAYQVEQDGKTWVNPVFRVRTGATLQAKLSNALDENTIIHWHGLKVDARNDAHPLYEIGAGTAYDYQFPVPNRAGTYWYHPHPDKLTSKQAYLGLAGFFIVEDDEELALQKALDLKLGATDIPLVIQDKKFDEQGRLLYAPNEEEKVNGYIGDTVLVNLTPRPHFNAATRIYRFRILNGSNARIYRLGFAQGGRPLEYQVIGTDGGLLDRPYPVKEAFLAPGERLDVLLDLRAAAVGDAVMLQSLAFDPMHAEGSMAGMAMDHGAMGGMDHGAQPGMLADGAAIDLLRINVASKAAYEPRVPPKLSTLAPVKSAVAKAREFVLDLKDRRWRINGEVFEMNKTPVTVQRGVNEIWEVRNDKASMPHPMHLHGVPFRVLGRSGSPQQLKSVIVNEQGLTATDLGWKDTVLVWPGETVRLAVDFSHPYPGDQIYLFHCHNLEHEDQGMMINIKVQA